MWRDRTEGYRKRQLYLEQNVSLLRVAYKAALSLHGQTLDAGCNVTFVSG
jgi:hypothetical protein